jgi:hypothetical protein
VKNRFQSLPFKFNLQRYTAAGAMHEAMADIEAGLPKLNQAVSHSSKGA